MLCWYLRRNCFIRWLVDEAFTSSRPTSIARWGSGDADEESSRRLKQRGAMDVISLTIRLRREMLAIYFDGMHYVTMPLVDVATNFTIVLPSIRVFAVAGDDWFHFRGFMRWGPTYFERAVWTGTAAFYRWSAAPLIILPSPGGLFLSFTFSHQFYNTISPIGFLCRWHFISVRRRALDWHYSLDYGDTALRFESQLIIIRSEWHVAIRCFGAPRYLREAHQTPVVMGLPAASTSIAQRLRPR